MDTLNKVETELIKSKSMLNDRGGKVGCVTRKLSVEEIENEDDEDIACADFSDGGAMSELLEQKGAQEIIKEDTNALNTGSPVYVLPF
jgi:hypothetical protein